MKYKANKIANKYGIELADFLKAIECKIIEVDENGWVSLDTHLYNYLKRYKQVKSNLPKKAMLKVNEIGGTIYEEYGKYYAITTDCNLLVTSDFMTANRFITMKEEIEEQKSTTITLNKTEIMFLLEHPLLTKHYAIKEKLNKALKKTL